ncbi:hypothetical protein BH11CYA1_BH11CYA1_08940 [soil metagenome]
MKTLITPEAHARALVVAENLKNLLEARLIGKTSHGFSCSCGACSAGPSRVVAINIPMQFPYQIAMCLLWTCEMKDDTGKRWTQGISTYIPWSELFPLFRQAFAGIDVRVEHAYAQSYHGSPGPFQASGRTVEISTKQQVFVRPAGDLSQTVWVNAELRIDSHLKQYASDEAFIACNIDALEFGQEHGRHGRHYSLTGGQQAFFIYISGAGHGKDIYLPIARVVTANKRAGKATLELDQSVEVFTPPVMPV